LQSTQPSTGGRHTEVCIRQANDDPRFGTPPSFMTTDVVTVRSPTLLPELVREIVNVHADCVIVLDELDRPIGILSAADILSRAHSGGN
jgi:CBS domain-containing protein